MKRMITLALVAMLVFAMAVPAYAHDGSAVSAKAWSSWFDWFGSFGSGGSAGTTNPETGMAAPDITEARFYHSGAIASMKNRLQISWDAVDGAESYEVKIVKADGTIVTYTTGTNLLMVKNSVCPKVFVDATDTWTAATVRVRAVVDNRVGRWSGAAEIGCDKIH